MVLFSYKNINRTKSECMYINFFSHRIMAGATELNLYYCPSSLGLFCIVLFLCMCLFVPIFARANFMISL
jgi:hypothetical protein